MSHRPSPRRTTPLLNSPAFEVTVPLFEDPMPTYLRVPANLDRRGFSVPMEVLRRHRIRFRPPRLSPRTALRPIPRLKLRQAHLRAVSLPVLRAFPSVYHLHSLQPPPSRYEQTQRCKKMITADFFFYDVRLPVAISHRVRRHGSDCEHATVRRQRSPTSITREQVHFFDRAGAESGSTCGSQLPTVHLYGIGKDLCQEAGHCQAGQGEQDRRAQEV